MTTWWMHFANVCHINVQIFRCFQNKRLKILHFITFYQHELTTFSFYLETITLSQYNSFCANSIINDLDNALLLNLHSLCGASASFLAIFPSYVAHVLLANNTSSRSTTIFHCCMPTLISVSYVMHVLLHNSASSITVFLCCMPTLRLVF